MDAYMYQTRIEALAQQVSGPFTAPVMQDALRSLLALFEEHYDAYMALTNAYRRLTATLSRLTAERETLAEAAADAYEAGLKAYLAYTNDFLQAHQDAWEQYLHTSERLVVDPAALHTIDPRPQDTALRLCHICRNTLR